MFQCLLLALDETASGEIGLSFATALAREHGSSVHIFHANELILGGRGVAVETSEEASRLVNVAVDRLGEAGVEASGEWTLANRFTLPWRIADAAARSGAGAILFGSHRHRRLHRLFGRGIRERVTRITPLPVLTAPPPLRLGGRRRGPMAEARRLARCADSAMRT